jgi:hypothetical protein
VQNVGKHTPNTSKGRFCETRLHPYGHVVLVFLGLQQVGTVLLCHPWRERLLSGWENGSHEREWHCYVVEVDEPVLTGVRRKSVVIQRSIRPVNLHFEETVCRHRYSIPRLSLLRRWEYLLSEKTEISYIRITKDTGNKVSRRATISGPQNIILGGKTIISNGAIIRGDLKRAGPGHAVVISLGRYCLVGEGCVMRCVPAGYIN